MSSSQDPLGLSSSPSDVGSLGDTSPSTADCVSLPFQPSHAGSLATNPTAPATDTPDVPRPRRKRHQSKRACAPCHDRKTACGEVRPCDRCVRLGHPELCVDFTPTRQKQTRRSQAVASSLAVFPSLPSSTSFETLTSESAGVQPPKVEEPLVVVPSVPPSATPMPRFLDDEVCSVVEGLESRLSSGECSLNLIISTAYIVHEISQIAHLYWEAIRHWFESESTKAGKQLGLAESCLMRAKTRSSQLSPRESPYNGMFSAISPQPSMIASTNFYLSPPRSVQETPWQCLMLAFSRAYSLCWSDPDTDLFSVSETAIQLAPSKLPSYEVPPIAHPAEKRLFSILDRWKRHRATRLYLARYVDPMRVFNLNILLEAEQVRSQFVPFGVVLVSLYPAPDMLYPRWCSPNFARALGYTPSEMRELDRTGKEGSKYLKLYPVETCRQVMCLLYTMISSGSTSWTGPIVLLNKFGCPVKFILSLSMRFQTGIPMYAVSYYQIWTPPGELAVLCHRPH